MSNRDRIPRTLNEAFGPHTSGLCKRGKSTPSMETKILQWTLIAAYIGVVVWCFL